MDAKSLFLTGDTDTVYFFVNLDASEGQNQFRRDTATRRSA